MREVCRVRRWEIPSKFSLNPPDYPAVLTHWRVLIELLGLTSRSPQDSQDRLQCRRHEPPKILPRVTPVPQNLGDVCLNTVSPQVSDALHTPLHRTPHTGYAAGLLKAIGCLECHSVKPIQVAAMREVCRVRGWEIPSTLDYWPTGTGGYTVLLSSWRHEPQQLYEDSPVC
jgi:hypothetical protein